MDLNIPGPTAFFYVENWSADCDDTLVKCLVSLKSDTRWTLKHFPSWFLLTAQRQLQRKHSVFFSEAELSQRVEHLHKRYKTFKAVVHTNGAHWDMENKYVRASDDLWHKIIKKNEFAGAYYYHDEHMYSSLACLFGMDDVKVEEEIEVIDISDNTAKIMSEDTMPVDLEEDDEEVNSPAVFRRPNVKRKLFDEDEMPTDKESSTTEGSYLIEVAGRGQLQPRATMSRSLPKTTTFGSADVGPSTKSPHTSSCASNSPIGWLPQSRK